MRVIAERMPPGAREDMHDRRHSRQFFYILSGHATMRLQEGVEVLPAGTGVKIAPMQIHQMQNMSPEDLQFLVFSVPKAHSDKVVISASDQENKA